MLQLDSKQSPLALLAQTCDSIGKDSPPPKPVSSGEKKSVTKEDKVARKPSPGLPEQRSPHSTSGSSSDKNRVSPVSSKEKDTSNTRPASRDSPRHADSTSRPRTASPIRDDKYRDTVREASCSPKVKATVTETVPRPGSSSPSSMSLTSKSKISLSCGNVSVEVKHQESVRSSPLSATSRSSAPSTSESLPAHATPLTSLPGSYHGLSMLGHHLPPGAESAAAAHASYAAHGLSAAHAHAGLGLPSPHKPGSTGLPPYLHYTSVKTASGTTLVPMCKDPCCTQCQLSSRTGQLGGGAPCPPGCTQCPSDRGYAPGGSLAAQSAALGLSSHLYPGASSASAHLLSSPLYQHAFSVLPGQTSLPYACSWLQGTDYCGKRFSTSEELLSHLRTHTTALGESFMGLPSALPYPNLGLTTASAAAAAAAAAHGLHGSHYPMSLSPNSLRHHSGYPRSLSPSSLLGASRFHPYKSALSSMASPPPSLPGGLPPHLSPYYLPYSLYGQRLGAA